MRSTFDSSHSQKNFLPDTSQIPKRLASKFVIYFCGYALLAILLHSLFLRNVLGARVVTVLADEPLDAFFVGTTAAMVWFVLHRLGHAHERAAEESRAHLYRFRSLFEHMLDGAAYGRLLQPGDGPADFLLIEVNSAFRKVMGERAVEGKTLREAFPQLLTPAMNLLPMLERVKTSGRPERMEIEFKHLAETFEVSVYGMGGDDYLFTFEIITKAKQVLADLATQESQLRLFVEQSPAAIAMFDTDMRYLVASQRWVDDYRLGDTPLIGRSHYDVFPEIPERWRAAHRRCLEGAVEKRHEDSFLREDGSMAWLRWEIQPWRRHDGNIGGIIIFSEDITTRVEAQTALQEGEAQLRALGDNLPNSYVYRYRQGPSGENVFEYMSAGAEVIHGIPPAELIRDGSRLIEQIPPEQVPMLVEAGNVSKATMNDFDVEIQMRRPGEDLRWLRLHSRPRYRGNGEIVWDGIVTDITESKKKSEGLLLFRALIDQSSDSIFVVDPGTGAILDANERACSSRGYTRAELLSLNVFDISVGLTQDRLAKINDIAHAQGLYTAESLHRRKDGSTFPVEVSRSTVVLDREYAVVTVRDITERKLAEEERARLAKALEQAAESVIITNGAGEITYVNPAFERVYGYRREEVLGQNPRILKSEKHGVQIYQELWKTLTAGRVWSGRISNRKKNGTLVDLDVVITPVLDAEGKIDSYVGLQRDVTNQVQLERRLQQAQKLEAMGTLAGGIAHDFNNILGAIVGYGELVASALPEGSREHADIAQVLMAAQRATALVRQILTFSRRIEGERKPVAIGAIAKETMKLLRPSLPTTIKIQLDIPAEPLMVLSDPTQIHQIIMNLCTNAYHAMADSGGTLSIRLCALESEEVSRLELGLAPTAYVQLTVEDTGYGIPESNLERIFDPFFTTKGVGEGTGLGLSTVHGIVVDGGGTITVSSAVGKGSTFRVYLPRYREDATVSAPEDNELVGGTERILLVDDEPALARLIARVLTSLGYVVTMSYSSPEALAQFQAAPDAFDLLMTDQTMPQMTGAALATAVRQLRPELPVLVCTGQMQGKLHEQLAHLDHVMLLAKPVDLHTLARAVREALDQPNSSAAG